MIIRGRRKWLSSADYCGKRSSWEIIGNPYFRRRWFNAVRRKKSTRIAYLCIIIKNILMSSCVGVQSLNTYIIWTVGRQVTWPPTLPLPRSWHRSAATRTPSRFLHFNLYELSGFWTAFVPRSRCLLLSSFIPTYNVYIYNVLCMDWSVKKILPIIFVKWLSIIPE